METDSSQSWGRGTTQPWSPSWEESSNQKNKLINKKSLETETFSHPRDFKSELNGENPGAHEAGRGVPECGQFSNAQEPVTCASPHTALAVS